MQTTVGYVIQVTHEDDKVQYVQPNNWYTDDINMAKFDTDEVSITKSANALQGRYGTRFKQNIAFNVVPVTRTSQIGD